MPLGSTIVAGVLLLVAASADAQVLTTADTIGKGKNAILVSDNVLVPGDGIPNLNIAFGEYARGLSERFDLYLIAGETTTDGSTQGWLAGGGNLRLARVGRVTLSWFNVASVPLNHRDEACQVLWNPALVVSAPAGKALTLYTGVNSLIPIGDRARGVFTPPTNKVNVPIGATYAFGAWGLWAEADLGNLNALGIGVTRVW